MGEVFSESLTSRLAEAVDKHGDEPAVVVMDNGPNVSHKELQAAVEGVAAQICSAGIQPGDLVSLAFPNSLEFVVAFLGVTRCRATAAPLNAAYTEEEFRFYLEDAKSQLLLVPSVGASAAAVAAAKSLNIPSAKLSPYTPEKGVQLELSDGLQLGPDNGPGPSPDGNDVALFLHTSGTTSRPKGVPLTQANLAASIHNIIGSYEFTKEDKTLIVMPLFHVHGLMAALLSTLAAGGTALLPSGSKFSASTFWKDMKAGGATWYTAVPTIHQILLSRHRDGKDLKTGEYPKLRFIRSCSASLAPAVLAGLEESFGAPVLEAYAMTEASHQMCSNPLPHHGSHKPGSVGRRTGIELAVLDDAGNVLPPGTIGEVCIRGPNVTAGYRDNPKANEAAFAFGWFHTGDQGKLDEEGYLTLTGRIKELINRGGEKISPVEVDAALLAQPAVSEAVAFAAPDPHYGEEVNAAVVLRESATLTESELKDALKKQLAAFKMPKKIFFVEKVPRTATGKIQRRFVAEEVLKNSKAPAAAAAQTANGSAPAAASKGNFDGNEFAAHVLAKLGIRYMFGVVGIPVTYFATAAQKAGIRFIAFRNEQAAGYAAGAAGYLTGVPGALLTVSGPGCVHGLAGLSNAMINTWPMVMISGSSVQADVGTGDFQELDQLTAVKPFVKYAGKPKVLEDIPRIAQSAVHESIRGRPGGSYIDLPADLLHSTMSAEDAKKLLDQLEPFVPSWAAPSASPSPLAPAPVDSHTLEDALALLKEAQKPLVVVGKGAGYARAEAALLRFVESTGIHFLATPMGKGVLPDTHPLSAGAARSLALAQADVVLVVGARLNWMLHFGRPPRWSPTVKFILVEVDPKEVELRKPAVGLVGDAKATLEALNAKLGDSRLKLEEDNAWVQSIKSKVAANSEKLKAGMAKDVVPLNFQCSLRIIKEAIQAVGSPSPILVSEGANTMDIGRTILEQVEPRTRLDAGTWGTMGVGMGYAIAAAVTQPDRLVVAVEGDSAFGFSGLEVETIVRYNLPIVTIVMNNGGVYGGDRRGHIELPDGIKNDPAPTSFVPSARYDLIIEAFGGKGYLVNTPEELSQAVTKAFRARKPALINVIIDPLAGTESGGMTHRN